MENPKIRFKGFTKDWEQRKLSDVLDIVTKRNGESTEKKKFSLFQMSMVV